MSLNYIRNRAGQLVDVRGTRYDPSEVGLADTWPEAESESVDRDYNGDIEQWAEDGADAIAELADSHSVSPDDVRQLAADLVRLMHAYRD